MKRKPTTAAGPQPHREPPAGHAPAVEAIGLVKRCGEQTTVGGLDVVVDRGEVVALLGPSGAGKSATVDLLLGLTRPDAGTVTLFGQSPTRAARAGLVSAMFHGTGLLYDVTVRTIVALAASLHTAPLPVDEVLRRTGLTDLAGRRPTRLSDAELRLVRFAVALVGGPELLILDEPTSAMDDAARRHFSAGLRRFTDEGRTVVFTTRRLDEAEEFADRVLLLRGGRVIADGPVSEVRAAVSGRVLRAVIPDGRLPELLALPGVLDATLHGDRFELKCADADAPLQALLAMYPLARDIEVTPMDLEEAFRLLAPDAGAADTPALAPDVGAADTPALAPDAGARGGRG